MALTVVTVCFNYAGIFLKRGRRIVLSPIDRLPVFGRIEIVWRIRFASNRQAGLPARGCEVFHIDSAIGQCLAGPRIIWIGGIGGNKFLASLSPIFGGLALFGEARTIRVFGTLIERQIVSYARALMTISCQYGDLVDLSPGSVIKCIARAVGESHRRKHRYRAVVRSLHRQAWKIGLQVDCAVVELRPI